MSFESVASQMIVLFLAMIFGFVGRKCNVMNDEIDRGLSDLVIGITLPCMIVASVVTNENLPDAATIGSIFGFSCLSYIVILAIALVTPHILRAEPSTRGTYRFAAMFGNVGFVGMPVLASIFGPEAVFYVAIFNIPFNVLLFTIGVMMISDDDGGTIKERLAQGVRSLRSPCTLSSFLAVILALLGVSNLGVIGTALDTVGSMTTPAAVLIIGSSLAKMPLRTVLGNPRAYAVSFVRLLVVPLAVFGIFHFFVTDPMVLGVLVITAGMPVATNGTMFCIRYNGDLKTMTQATFVSTVCALVTIPAITMLIV